MCCIHTPKIIQRHKIPELCQQQNVKLLIIDRLVASNIPNFVCPPSSIVAGSDVRQQLNYNMYLLFFCYCFAVWQGLCGSSMTIAAHRR